MVNDLKVKHINGVGRVLAFLTKYLFMLLLVAVSVAPLVWVFMSSFKTQFEIMSSPLKLPVVIRFAPYARAIKIAPILQFYKNSIIVAVSTTVITVVIVSMAAFVVSKYDFKGKKLIVLMFASCLLVPGIALSQPVFRLMNILHIYNSLAALILVHTAFGLPVTFFILHSYFQTIPKELNESAYMDGAGLPRIYWQINMPIAKPGLATSAVLQFLLAWNEFYFSLILTSSNKCRTLPLSLNYFLAQFTADYPAMFAAVLMVITPTIILFIIMQEQIISSLTAGAVKG